MIKLGVIYGGMSSEHEISVKSFQYIKNNIDLNKYELYEIFIDKDGTWYKKNKPNKIENVFNYLKSLDVLFPVLHGKNGEDGTIQGMFEMIGVPYVGCNSLSSGLCMDKIYTKVIFDACGIKNARSININYKNDNELIIFDNKFNVNNVDNVELINIVNKYLNYPLFIKPSNSGSSIGVSRVDKEEDLINAIKEASEYDNKILIEEGIIGKEVEVAVLGDVVNGIEVSNVGEILSAETFYTYDAKYENNESKTMVPASLPNEIMNRIRDIAKKAYIAIDGKGLARVDFFVEEKTNKIYLNEINTIPGLTNISMYPILMREFGYTDIELIDKLISLATIK